jgi:hypothetical protein
MAAGAIVPCAIDMAGVALTGSNNDSALWVPGGTGACYTAGLCGPDGRRALQ